MCLNGKSLIGLCVLCSVFSVKFREKCKNGKREKRVKRMDRHVDGASEQGTKRDQKKGSSSSDGYLENTFENTL